MLISLQKGLKSAIKSPYWPNDLSCDTDKWTECPDCKKESQKIRKSRYSPQTHCDHCFPAVTHTKLGPCLIFQWGREKIPLTVDLIPVFPVNNPDDKTLLSLFNITIKTLLEKKPENWLKHFEGIIERDRLLPESFASSLEKDTTGTFDVAIKILNYGESNNIIIRPGQNLEVANEFDSEEQGELLRNVYTHAKALREVLRLNIKSYFLKKILLQDETKKVIKASRRLDEGLLILLSHQEVKKSFKGDIDFNHWERNIEQQKKGEHGRSKDKMYPYIPLTD